MTPFKRYKSWMHEGSICAPLIIVSWPAGIADPGVLHEGRYSIIDFMPAFPEVARASYPDTIRGKKTLSLSGVSMLANLKDGTGQTDRMLFWEHEGNQAVRQGRWKLSAKAKKNVEKYLGHSIVYCAFWMNEYRSTPEYRHTTRRHGASMDKDYRYTETVGRAGGEVWCANWKMPYACCVVTGNWIILQSGSI